MYYRLDKNGPQTLIEVVLCEHHYKHFKYRTYYEISDSNADKCCSILYDGTRCDQVATISLVTEKNVREVALSEITEIKSVFKKHLKVFKLSKLQYENFNRFIFLTITTILQDVFKAPKEDSSFDYISKHEVLLKVQYSYFFEKLCNNFPNFSIEKINLSDDLNELFPRRVKLNSLQAIPEEHYKTNGNEFEQKMYRNYVIFMYLLHAINNRDDWSKNFFKEPIEEQSYARLFFELFKSLFNQIELIKETDFPKVHFLVEEKLQSTILPSLMLNILYHYDKELLEDSFN